MSSTLLTLVEKYQLAVANDRSGLFHTTEGSNGQKCPRAPGTWERPVQAVLPTSLLGGVLPVDRPHVIMALASDLTTRAEWSQWLLV